MTAIVNVTPNWGIGKDGRLLVSISEDLRRFRELTTDKPVVYGRKTMATFPGGKPLKNRLNLVLSTTTPEGDGYRVFSNVSELLRYLTANGGWAGAQVIGGETVYRELLPYCDKVELTRALNDALPADAYFPDLDALPEWKLRWEGPVLTAREDPTQQFQYATYVRPCPAVIFDLDGTLWNSVEQILPAWNRVVGEYGKTITLDELYGFMGRTVEELAAMVLPELPAEEGAAVIDRCCREELGDLRRSPGTLYPALRETLRALAGKYRLMIVSNSQDGYVQTFLDSCGLWDYFSDIEMYGRTGKSKAENIRLVLQRSGAEQAVYVGDTESDALAAAEAGVPFVYAAYGFGAVDGAAHHVETPAELEGILAELLRD